MTHPKSGVALLLWLLQLCPGDGTHCWCTRCMGEEDHPNLISDGDSPAVQLKRLKASVWTCLFHMQHAVFQMDELHPSANECPLFGCTAILHPPPPPLSLALTSQLQLCCVATSTFKKTGLTTWGSDFSTVWPKQFVPQWLSDPNFTQGTTKMLSHQNNKCTCYTITGGLQFRVVVEDNAVVNPKSATATVTVSITRDTSPPRFIQDPYSTTINYDEQVGSSVYLLSATDPDLIVSWLEFSVGVAVSLHSLFAGEYIYITICSLHQGQWEEFLEFGGMLKFEELVPFTP